MERFNTKYNLDSFSDSELNSESDEGEQYKYENGNETLTWYKCTIHYLRICHFAPVSWALTLFLKCHLPFLFWKVKCINIFSLITTTDW